MLVMLARAALGAAMLFAASPLIAGVGARAAESIPEPSNIALLGLGMLGLILGRRGGRRKPRD